MACFGEKKGLPQSENLQYDVDYLREQIQSAREDFPRVKIRIQNQNLGQDYKLGLEIKLGFRN